MILRWSKRGPHLQIVVEEVLHVPHSVRARITVNSSEGFESHLRIGRECRKAACCYGVLRQSLTAGGFDRRWVTQVRVFLFRFGMFSHIFKKLVAGRRVYSIGTNENITCCTSPVLEPERDWTGGSGLVVVNKPFREQASDFGV